MSLNIQKNQFDIFNFIRVLAVLCVFGLHFVITCKDVLHYTDSEIPSILYTPVWAAMWMFFFLSGYLIGKGFYNRKYSTTKDGIILFYKKRFLRITPLYFFFLFFVFLFINPTYFFDIGWKNNLKLFLFAYNGNPGTVGIGATWFVSTIIQLYILAPFLYKYIVSKLDSKLKNFIFLSITVLLGLIIRILECYFNLDWYEYTYTLSLSNIDIFFAGMLLNGLTQNAKNTITKEILKPWSVLVLLLFILFNIHCIYSNSHIHIYKYYFPTIYTILLCLVIYFFDCNKKIQNIKLNLNTIIHHPCCMIDAFAGITYPFFIFHSNILETIPKLSKIDKFSGGVKEMFVISFVLCICFASIMHYLFEKKVANLIPSESVNIGSSINPHNFDDHNLYQSSFVKVNYIILITIILLLIYKNPISKLESYIIPLKYNHAYIISDKSETIFCHGCNVSEKFGMWTQDKQAMIKLELTNNPTKDLGITLNVGLLNYPNANNYLRIVMPNGNVLYENHFPDGKDSEIIRFLYKKESVKNKQINLFLESNVRPHKVLNPKTDDPRTLGIFLTGIQIDEKDE